MKKHCLSLVAVFVASVPALDGEPTVEGIEGGFGGLFEGGVPASSVAETPQESYMRMLDASLRRSFSQEQFDRAVAREQARIAGAKKGGK